MPNFYIADIVDHNIVVHGNISDIKRGDIITTIDSEGKKHAEIFIKTRSMLGETVMYTLGAIVDEETQAERVVEHFYVVEQYVL